MTRVSIKGSFFESCHFWVAGANLILYAVNGGNVLCVRRGHWTLFYRRGISARYQTFEVVCTDNTICCTSNTQSRQKTQRSCSEIETSQNLLLAHDAGRLVGLFIDGCSSPVLAYARYRLSTGTTRLGTYIGINHRLVAHLGSASVEG